jgi:excisionase family DNA binding protein
LNLGAIPAPLLTFDDVAELLALSLSLVRRLVASGQLPVLYVGRRSPRFRAGDVLEFVERSGKPASSTSTAKSGGRSWTRRRVARRARYR